MTGTATANRKDLHGHAIVVGGSSAGRLHAREIAAEEGLQTTTADDPQGLADACSRQLTAIVLICDDESSSPWSEAMALVREAVPQACVVVVLESSTDSHVRAALADGATGIVDAAELATTLAPCLRAVLAGQICVPNGCARAVERPVLSAREKQILGLVVMGYMNAQIAEQLFLAESTVKSHLSSAFAKLGVRSRYEAVDLILDPARGLALGILALGGEPLAAGIGQVS